MRTPAAVVLSCWFAFAAPASAQTQITTGVIQGTVTDATGGTLPGVTVEARNAETNLSRTLTTGSDGRFVFLQLPSGTYSVAYTLSGFATLV
ncbi:MAG TPA: carboxypeptidase-like regulatory domain-containing protein, partial [Vicinamibacterales bacterium]